MYDTASSSSQMPVCLLSSSAMKLLAVLLLVSGALAQPGDLSKMNPKLAEFFKKNFGAPGGEKPPPREEVTFTLVEKTDKFEVRHQSP